MKPRINMITLGVKDMERAIRFYADGLGLPRMPFEGGAAFFTLSGSWLSLYPWDALADDATVDARGEGFRGITLAHVVSSKKEVNDILDQAVKAGGKLIKPGQDVFWAGIPGTSLILMDTYGRWPGTLISGPARTMTTAYSPGVAHITRHSLQENL
jgi:uncharacterized protein